MLQNQTDLDLKYYIRSIEKGHTNYRAHGGVVTFINEKFPYQKLTFNTPQQAIETRINKGRDVTIVSILNS